MIHLRKRTLLFLTYEKETCTSRDEELGERKHSGKTQEQVSPFRFLIFTSRPVELKRLSAGLEGGSKSS